MNVIQGKMHGISQNEGYGLQLTHDHHIGIIKKKIDALIIE